MAHQLEKKWRSKDVQLQEKADFSVMLLSDRVLSGLKKAGFKIPSPIQLEAIPIGRFGKDLLVQAKSGTGKTLVFTIIALEMLKHKLFRPQVLILAPTREIAAQICSVVQSVGSSFHKLTCCSFIGGLPLQDDKDRGSACQIVVGTPGRVRQLIKLGSLPTNSIRLLVFDEADQLFHGTFKLEIDDIFSSLPADKQVIATSATFPTGLRKIIFQYLRDPFVASINSTDLSLLGIVHYTGIVANSLMPLLEYKNKLVVLEKVLTTLKFCQCLVFCNMIGRVEVLCRDIKKWGFSTAYISSAKEQAERLKVLDRLKHFKCKVLVSSDVTSRGIDAENVDLVINFDLALSTETYLHRVGRAGRYGSIGLAVSIITDKQLYYLKKIEEEGGFKSYKLPDTLPKDLIRNPTYDEYTIKEEPVKDTSNGNRANTCDKVAKSKNVDVEDNGFTHTNNGLKVENSDTWQKSSSRKVNSNNENVCCDSSDAVILDDFCNGVEIKGHCQSDVRTEIQSAISKEDGISIVNESLSVKNLNEETSNEHETKVKTAFNDLLESCQSDVCSISENKSVSCPTYDCVNGECLNSAEETKKNVEFDDEQNNILIGSVNHSFECKDKVCKNDVELLNSLSSGDICLPESKDSADIVNVSKMSNEIDDAIYFSKIMNTADLLNNVNASKLSENKGEIDVTFRDTNDKSVTGENGDCAEPINPLQPDMEKYIQKYGMDSETELDDSNIDAQSDTSINNAISAENIRNLQSKKQNFFCQVFKQFQEDIDAIEIMRKMVNKITYPEKSLNQEKLTLVYEDDLINEENESNGSSLFEEANPKNSSELKPVEVCEDLETNTEIMNDSSNLKDSISEDNDSSNLKDSISEDIHPIDKPKLQSTPGSGTKFEHTTTDESDSDDTDAADSTPVPLFKYASVNSTESSDSGSSSSSAKNASISSSADSSSDSSSISTSDSSVSSKEIKFKKSTKEFKNARGGGEPSFRYSIAASDVKEASDPHSYKKRGRIVKERRHSDDKWYGVSSRNANYPQQMKSTRSANFGPSQRYSHLQSHCMGTSCKERASCSSKKVNLEGKRRQNTRNHHCGTQTQRCCIQSACCNQVRSSVACCCNSCQSCCAVCYPPIPNFRPYDIFYQQWRYIQNCVDQCCNSSAM